VPWRIRLRSVPPGGHFLADQWRGARRLRPKQSGPQWLDRYGAIALAVAAHAGNCRSGIGLVQVNLRKQRSGIRIRASSRSEKLSAPPMDRAVSALLTIGIARLLDETLVVMAANLVARRGLPRFPGETARSGPLGGCQSILLAAAECMGARSSAPRDRIGAFPAKPPSGRRICRDHLRSVGAARTASGTIRWIAPQRLRRRARSKVSRSG